MKTYTNYFLTFLRIVVGWHFMYEGIAKLMIPGWTAKSYLMGSKWIFAGILNSLASSPQMMNVVDFLNIWGLILIGLSLFTGLFVRWSSVAGAVLLLFYFVAYPPIPGYTLGNISEGSYLIVNKVLVEFFILIVFIALPVDFMFGADRWIKRWKDEKAQVPVPPSKEESSSLKRREIIRDLISVPFLGAFAYAVYRKQKWNSFEEKFLNGQPDAVSAATLKTFSFASLENLKGQVPKGKIGDMELSRMIMGGNLIGGWAHARDLIYASKLVKAYHTDERVMMTLELAEKCGINAIITNPALSRIMNKYWHETRGKMQFISDCGDSAGFISGIRKSEEAGAKAMYCQGGIADKLVFEGKYEEIEKGIELIRSLGKPAGIGAHRIETVKGCVENGIIPDFWVKTMHHHNYWSAQVDPEKRTTVENEYKDNIFCFKPQETIDFMNGLEQPWIAFKVLAAGAITPEDGFKYAFDSGADFICVGMYDFQIVDDTNILLDTIPKINRNRLWRG